MIHFVLITILIIHGIAHLPGFAVPWQLIQSPDFPYRTTVFSGQLEIGDVGVRVVGLAWATMAIAFVALAWAMWLEVPWARMAIVAAVTASLLLCASGWPEARLGLFANLLLVTLLAVAR